MIDIPRMPSVINQRIEASCSTVITSLVMRISLRFTQIDDDDERFEALS